MERTNLVEHSFFNGPISRTLPPAQPTSPLVYQKPSNLTLRETPPQAYPPTMQPTCGVGFQTYKPPYSTTSATTKPGLRSLTILTTLDNNNWVSAHHHRPTASRSRATRAVLQQLQGGPTQHLLHPGPRRHLLRLPQELRHHRQIPSRLAIPPSMPQQSFSDLCVVDMVVCAGGLLVSIQG
ncbi:hypothetical protein EDB80DRAFT_383427 [Ilyonectria destructans]|nr:hypothetical protein EDB80DRAFT_383427 [Ilyonectria destructans]